MLHPDCRDASVGDDWFGDAIYVFFVFSRVGPETPTKVAQRTSNIVPYLIPIVYNNPYSSIRIAFYMNWYPKQHLRRFRLAAGAF